MKFNCGPDAAEKRRLTLEQQKARAEWHPWFAWRPVRVGPYDCRWLETVERRFKFDRIAWDLGYYRSCYTPEYRARGSA